MYVFYYTCIEMECVFIAGNCVCMCLYMHRDSSHLECPCDWREEGGGESLTSDSFVLCVAVCQPVCVCVDVSAYE